MRTTTLLLLLFLALLLLPPPLLAQQGGGEDEMRDANRAAGVLVTERMKRDRKTDYETLCRIRRPDVLVVTGAYDRVEQVLDALSVPYTAVSPAGLSRADLLGVEIVLVNCPGRIPEAAAWRLREWVHRGGLLVTTDWAVQNVHEKVFPGTIRYTRRPTRDDVVAIRVVAKEHDLLEHVLTGDSQHVWWLEDQSYPFTVTNRRRVKVLVDSPEMAKKYGEGSVVVTFGAGRGRVVHMISHLYLQRSELRGRRDILPAGAVAEDLGFEPDSPAMKEIERRGLAKAKAGRVRSAYSALQFLANLLVSAKGEAVEPPRPEPPRPVPPRPEPPRPATGAEAATPTTLRATPDGEPLKAIPRGLRLDVLDRRAGWVKVATPAGETGWLPAGAVRE